MTERIVVAKAQPIGDRTVPGVVVEIAGSLPYYRDMGDMDAFMDGQAAGLEAALHNSLPGGTYDRLLGQMLARKASHFRVAFGERPS